MRTIKVELVAPQGDQLGSMFGGGARIHISTESMIETDEDARQAGRDARSAVDAFIAGYSEDDSDA